MDQLAWLKRSHALDAGGVDYAVVGGNAVAAWVAGVDISAVRNTQDVDILLNRADLSQAIAELERTGFHFRHAAGVDGYVLGRSPG